MYLGYVFDMFDADAKLAVHQNPRLKEDAVMFQDSSILEELADKLNAEFLLLNWDYCAFVNKKTISPGVYLNKKMNADFETNNLELKNLKEGLIANGLDPDKVSLLEEPEWTRHGEPVTYENWKPEIV